MLSQESPAQAPSKAIDTSIVGSALVPVCVVDVISTSVWVVSAVTTLLGMIGARWIMVVRPLSDGGVGAQMSARYNVVGGSPILVQ